MADNNMTDINDLMIRMTEYQELLAGRGIQADLVLTAEEKLFLEFYMGEIELQLTGVPEGDGFLVSAVSRFEVPQEDQMVVQSLCDIFNEDTIAGFAYTAEEKSKLYYRQLIPDVDNSMTDENLMYFLAMYQVHAVMLQEMLASLRQEDEE